MREVDYSEYFEYVSRHKTIIIENTEIKLEAVIAERLKPLPGELTDISTTVWSFPREGPGLLVEVIIAATGLSRYLVHSLRCTLV